jgi:hypothetical protein
VLSLSLDRTLLIAHSVFSNVYFGTFHTQSHTSAKFICLMQWTISRLFSNVSRDCGLILMYVKSAFQNAFSCTLILIYVITID